MQFPAVVMVPGLLVSISNGSGLVDNIDIVNIEDMYCRYCRYLVSREAVKVMAQYSSSCRKQIRYA